VDHTASIATEQNWRATALIASAIAGLELFVLVVLGLTYVGKPAEHAIQKGAAASHATKTRPATQSTKAPAARKTKAPAALPRRKTSVLILNGNGLNGVAGQKSTTLHSLGYMIAGTGNASRTDFPRTVVMYREGFKPEAKRLAKDLHGIHVVPLDGLTAAGLNGAHLALVLGGDAAGHG
jgi:LytR cell envelope-related transcriptional attenuator